jgi:hypothetical protein
LGKESFPSSKKIHLHIWGSKILSLSKERFSSSKEINVAYLGKQELEFREGTFLRLKIDKPCSLKQVKIAKFMWQILLNFEKLVFY